MKVVNFVTYCILPLLTAADLHTLNVMKDLLKDALVYQKSFQDFNGGLLQAGSILRQTRALTAKMRDAEAHPKSTEHERTTPEQDVELTTESLEVATKLSMVIGATVDESITKKAQLDFIPMVSKPIIIHHFDQLRAASMDLAKLFAQKGYDENKMEETNKILADMDEHFSRGSLAWKDEL